MQSTMTDLTDNTVDTLPKDKVLIFGGNGFIGAEVVETLIKRNQYDLYLVSRGNWYFDSATRVKPFVTHMICDRENSDLEFCPELMELVNKEGNHFKWVFDFSAYKPEVLEASLEILNGKTDLYIYISSDSVYEVCEDKRNVNGGLSREIDSIRPTNEDERERLNDMDEYGNEKFSGEEVLLENYEKNGTPYLIVRLPDVLGPRDTTDRIWVYILWIQFFDFIKVPIIIPESARTLRTSYVYVKDVSRALFHLIDNGFWKNEVYNLGFENTYTLQELVQTLSSFISKKVEFMHTKHGKYNAFPSVTRGGVDISKLRGTGFIPTDFKTAMNETVMYYKTAFYTQPGERDDAVHQLTKYVVPREKKGDFLQYIDRIAEKGPNGGPPMHNEL